MANAKHDPLEAAKVTATSAAKDEADAARAPFAPPAEKPEKPSKGAKAVTKTAKPAPAPPLPPAAPKRDTWRVEREHTVSLFGQLTKWAQGAIIDPTHYGKGGPAGQEWIDQLIREGVPLKKVEG